MSLARACGELVRRVFMSSATRERERAAALAAARRLLGDQPFIAVDVGAANGLLPHWESLDGVADIVQVEPRGDSCADLRNRAGARATPSRYHVVQAALSEGGGKRTLFVSNAPTGSSLLRIDPAASPDCRDYIDLTYLYPITEVPIDTVTLTHVLEGLSLPRVGGRSPPAEGEAPVPVEALIGRYGPYLKRGTDSRSLETHDQIFAITLAEAEALFAQPKKGRGRRAQTATRA